MMNDGRNGKGRDALLGLDSCRIYLSIHRWVSAWTWMGNGMHHLICLCYFGVLVARRRGGARGGYIM
jgi:hypothetical protein